MASPVTNQDAVRLVRRLPRRNETADSRRQQQNKQKHDSGYEIMTDMTSLGQRSLIANSQTLHSANKHKDVKAHKKSPPLTLPAPPSPTPFNLNLPAAPAPPTPPTPLPSYPAPPTAPCNLPAGCGSNTTLCGALYGPAFTSNVTTFDENGVINKTRPLCKICRLNGTSELLTCFCLGQNDPQSFVSYLEVSMGPTMRASCCYGITVNDYTSQLMCALPEFPSSPIPSPRRSGPSPPTPIPSYPAPPTPCNLPAGCGSNTTLCGALYGPAFTSNVTTFDENGVINKTRPLCKICRLNGTSELLTCFCLGQKEKRMVSNQPYKTGPLDRIERGIRRSQGASGSARVDQTAYVASTSQGVPNSPPPPAQRTRDDPIDPSPLSPLATTFHPSSSQGISAVDSASAGITQRGSSKTKEESLGGDLSPSTSAAHSVKSGDSNHYRTPITTNTTPPIPTVVGPSAGLKPNSSFDPNELATIISQTVTQ
ncbi:hypothetical protein CEUSTIGMA_g1771.t1 [Chlamydomonas eustigma]|uniref:Uncharacterized protein n=1 Tax=Chlamydomonas eustigma TaxID=1157962 RepID=A0A250WUL0_9CHLO|nr:hypothetical protein CEUSTIGMA_g1771.t1 [Chlamydomonas eustigma]|eukprot:GAX74322.1 hypothetical protein CEUSTIGMA_g1771.t1 [Chlamydomonas eustigma]